MSRLAPLSEEPINEEEDKSNNCSKTGQSWKNWLKSHFPLVFNKKSDLKILLSVLGCPLFPVSVHPKLPIKEVCSSAQYIIQHFTAATGCRKLEGRVKNIFATGKVAMAMVDELGGSPGLAAGATAGSDGNVAWRHTPWLGAHAAKGCLRPLRRTLQASNVEDNTFI
ncbi:hypothetical protein GH714_037116 [Hevea brasiliensis]|uniref:Uncharacterized protein n=1 Tax=Hevea brasiliensis TaxID=3981 RepID=A0A6A6KNG4_HEVBR|nr:hypothetical protein GH714_037116 [Hevea brasiliensis]